MIFNVAILDPRCDGGSAIVSQWCMRDSAEEDARMRHDRDGHDYVVYPADTSELIVEEAS